MKCIRSMEKAYQVKVEATKSRHNDNVETRQEALAAHGSPSVWVMLEVDELTVGDAPTEPPDAVKGPLRDVATQLEAMSAGQVAEMVGICRTQKAFSKPGEHKKAKLLIMLFPRQQDGGGSTRRKALVTKGGTLTREILPKGALVRQLQARLDGMRQSG